MGLELAPMQPSHRVEVGRKGAALTPAVTSARVQETLDVVQSHFGLPTCLAYTVFKMFN